MTAGGGFICFGICGPAFLAAGGAGVADGWFGNIDLPVCPVKD